MSSYARIFFPKMRESINRIINMTNRIFAIEAAPAAIPVNPNTPAIKANTIKIMVQRNIEMAFMSYNLLFIRNPITR